MKIHMSFSHSILGDLLKQNAPSLIFGSYILSTVSDKETQQAFAEVSPITPRLKNSPMRSKMI